MTYYWVEALQKNAVVVVYAAFIIAMQVFLFRVWVKRMSRINIKMAIDEQHLAPIIYVAGMWVGWSIFTMQIAGNAIRSVLGPNWMLNSIFVSGYIVAMFAILTIGFRIWDKLSDWWDRDELLHSNNWIGILYVSCLWILMCALYGSLTSHGLRAIIPSL